MLNSIFYSNSDTCINYLKRWTKQFDVVESFHWAVLQDVPQWENIETTYKMMLKNGAFTGIDSDVDLFDQFGYLIKFTTTEKIMEWKRDKLPSDMRWVECFKHFSTNHVPYKLLSDIVQYVYCLPGTSASVERVFSMINRIWTKEKTRLEMATLESIIFVKCNMKFSCMEFFDLLRNSPDLVQKIASSEKYHQNTTTASSQKDKEKAGPSSKS
jgi:hAT family C-terminal dimerisation region